MLQGKKGVKYGLQLPARPAPKQVRKPQASISAFQEGSDDEDTIGQQIARQQAKISTDVKVGVAFLCVVASCGQCTRFSLSILTKRDLKMSSAR